MLKVELINFDDLTQDEQEFQPNNGRGKRYANYIKVTNEGKTVMILSDAVEPEDATFTRDFKDVVKAIKTAYVQGVKDGKLLKD